MTEALAKRIEALPIPDEVADDTFDAGFFWAQGEAAALARADAGAVRVKPLAWEAIEQDRGDGSSDLTGDWIAETTCGCYSIVYGFGTDSYTWDLYYGEMDCISTHDDPDAAKAAAQADYEARILAALDTAPVRATPVHEETNTPQREAFWKWLPLAYRDGHVGEGVKFTKYNMGTAHLAGWQAAIEASPAPDPIIKPDSRQLDHRYDRATAIQQAQSLILGGGYVPALPAPTDADLDAAALARPVVRAMVEAAEALKADMLERARMRIDTISGEQYRVVNAGDGAWSRFVAALAKAKEAGHDL